MAPPQPEAGRQVSAVSLCPNCGRPCGFVAACPHCRQYLSAAPGVLLASGGSRFGAYLLDGVLAVVTLGVGWLIWHLIVMAHGQSPAKQLLGMRAIKTNGTPAGWGTMFLRDWVGKFLIGLAVSFTFGIGLVLYFWLLWDPRKQELWDKIADTVVVKDVRRHASPGSVRIAP